MVNLIILLHNSNIKDIGFQKYFIIKKKNFFLQFYIFISILLFKGASPIWDPHLFLFKNAPTPLYLSRDKTKGQSGRNTILNLTKTLPKKKGHFR